MLCIFERVIADLFPIPILSEISKFLILGKLLKIKDRVQFFNWVFLSAKVDITFRLLLIALAIS